MYMYVPLAQAAHWSMLQCEQVHSDITMADIAVALECDKSFEALADSYQQLQLRD